MHVHWENVSLVVMVLSCYPSTITEAFPLPRLLPQRKMSNLGEYSFLVHSASSNEEWKVGDVDKDFYLLRQGIAKHQADDNMRTRKKLELLDSIAAGRRPLFQDIRNFLLYPTLLASILTTIMTSSFTPSLLRYQLFVGKGLSFISAYEFWMVVVMIPLILLLHHNMRSPLGKGEMVSSEDQNSFFSRPTGEKPLTDACDFTSCLLEQWTSAVIGIFCIGIWSSTSIILKRVDYSRLWPYLRFVTRIGAMTSLHQFQLLLYKLRHQPRPWRNTESHLIKYSNYMLKFGVLFGLPLNLFEIMLLRKTNPRRMLWFLYFFINTTVIMDSFRHSILYHWKKKEKLRLNLKKIVRKAYGLIPYIISGPSFLHILQLLSKIIFPLWPKEITILSTIPYPVALPLATLQISTIYQCFDLSPYLDIIPSCLMQPLLYSKLKEFYFPTLLSCFAPIWHISALIQLIQIRFTNNISLGTATRSKSKNQESLLSTAERRLRYYLKWREPQRLRLVVLKDIMSQKFKSHLQMRDTEGGERYRAQIKFEAGCRGKVRQICSNPKFTIEPRYRSTAMKTLNFQHEIDYKKGTYADPLGVAIQQTFGIGLSFDISHMDPLPPGEEPCLRRLQARAAKSAIDRVHTIYTNWDKGETGGIGELERNKRDQEEIDSMKDQLSELIPRTGVDSDEIKFNKLGISKWRRVIKEENIRMFGERESIIPSNAVVFERGDY